MESLYLVCYDICDPKRLSRLYRFMKGRGLHIQYSVFISNLTYPGLQELKEEIKRIINEYEDDVRIYPLPSNFLVSCMGAGSRIPEGVKAFFSNRGAAC
jgi:CRISPR-associated protein Cas2